MIYSKTSEYALRILVCFAKIKDKGPVKARKISAATGVPPAYLAKVLQCLVRNKFLRSEPGPTGGFVLQVDTSRLTVYEVLAAVDNFPKCQFADCVMGLKECNDKNPCILHDAWMETKNKIMKIVSRSTIEDLVSHPSSFRLGNKNHKMLSRSMRSLFSHYDAKDKQKMRAQ